MNKRLFVILCMCLVTFVSTNVRAHVDPGVDIDEYVQNSGLIFKGIVTEVAYKNSEGIPLLDATGQPVLEDGEPVYVDGSNLPHTFVTFLSETVYKGSTGNRTGLVTLRFEGGQSDVPDPEQSASAGETVYSDYMVVTDVPLFDVGDRDILFVKGNEASACPLYNWSKGRFRLLNSPDDPLGANSVFTEFGQEVRLVSAVGAAEFAILGDVLEMPQVHTHMMGQMELENVYVDDGNEETSPEIFEPLGVRASEQAFEALLTGIIQGQCGTVDPASCGVEIINADPSAPFEGLRLNAVAIGPTSEEPPTEFPRPWLDLLNEEDRNEVLESDRLETELFELSGGNPVLPETPCQFRLLRDGPLPGDISGPAGVPDCYVNLYDVAALASVWLECNNPDDATCFE